MMYCCYKARAFVSAEAVVEFVSPARGVTFSCFSRFVYVAISAVYILSYISA